MLLRIGETRWSVRLPRFAEESLREAGARETRCNYSKWAITFAGKLSPQATLTTHTHRNVLGDGPFPDHTKPICVPIGFIHQDNDVSEGYRSRPNQWFPFAHKSRMKWSRRTSTYILSSSPTRHCWTNCRQYGHIPQPIWHDFPKGDILNQLLFYWWIVEIVCKSTSAVKCWPLSGSIITKDFTSPKRNCGYPYGYFWRVNSD